jgi:hypothetical protein
VTIPDTQPAYSVLLAENATSTVTSSHASTAAASSTSAAHSSASTTPTSTPKKKNNGLAIGLGAGLGSALLLALVGLGAFCFIRKSKKNRANLDQNPVINPAEKHPLNPGESYYADGIKHDASPSQPEVHEAPGVQPYVHKDPAELHG